jgi:hypothetical protein
MRPELIGMTREQAMREATGLAILGTSEQILDLLRCAQWRVLVGLYGKHRAQTVWEQWLASDGGDDTEVKHSQPRSNVPGMQAHPTQVCCGKRNR